MQIKGKYKKSSRIFVQSIDSENKKINKLLDAPIFNIESKGKPHPGPPQREEEKKSGWNMFNLIPNRKNGDKEDVSYEYWLKSLCWIAANDNPRNYKWLYEECSLLQVYEIIMLDKAKKYELRH